MADKLLVDTSVLIAVYNRQQFLDILLERNDSKSLLFSVVTVNELIRGAHHPLSKEIAEDFLRQVHGRLITPSEGQWLECARISESILGGGRRSKEGVLLLQNDILIALGARDAAATLATCDRKDFGLLKGYIRLPIEYW